MRLFHRSSPQTGDERRRQDPAIDLGERFVEARWRLARVPEHRQPTTGPQHVGRLRRPRNRVHPMPTLPRDDHVEFTTLRLPCLERRHLDLHAAAPREPGQPCVRVDPQHLAASRLKLPRHDASTNAYVENESSRGCSDKALDQNNGIARPGAVIALWIRPERFGCLPLVMRLVVGNRRSLGRRHRIIIEGGHLASPSSTSFTPRRHRAPDVSGPHPGGLTLVGGT